MFAAEFAFGPMAAFTNDEGLAFFDPGYRKEEDLKIMINAFAIGLMQAANGAAPGIFVQNLRFWGDADDKEHGITVKIKFRRVRNLTAIPQWRLYALL
jgi:hypothetical protein